MSTQWANIGEDAGALHALVEQVPSHVPVEMIDYIWIFPSRRVAVGESIVVVVGGLDEDEARRRVFTLRFTISRNRKGAASVSTRVDEHGAAPAAAVPRIVQGVLRRLGEDAEAEPREEQIGGSPERWHDLIVALGGRPRSEEQAPASSGATRDGSESPPSPDADTSRAAAADPPSRDL